MVAKVADGTKWDHIAVVVKDMQTRQLMVLEATLTGVKLRPLKERLLRSAANEVAVRRLEVKTT